ncbi:MAG: hypothetical protein PHT60_09815 [Acidiphilium sp.]|nr:hypothetical protein [Acidiphilium sp.]MDD4936059.1 hypothetical protein [Acidiphilium sp.]
MISAGPVRLQKNSESGGVGVVIGMQLGGMFSMVDGMQIVALREVRMVRGLFGVFAAMMLGGLAVVCGRKFMMLGSFFVMFGDGFDFRHEHFLVRVVNGVPQEGFRRSCAKRY